MKKQEFLELFEAAIRAAKSAREKRNSSPQVTRCVDAMNRLKEVPESLALDVHLTTPSLGVSLTKVCTEHINPQIRAEAKNLLYTWLSYLYATGSRPKRSRRDDVKDRRGEKYRRI